MNSFASGKKNKTKQKQVVLWGPRLATEGSTTWWNAASLPPGRPVLKWSQDGHMAGFKRLVLVPGWQPQLPPSPGQLRRPSLKNAVCITRGRPCKGQYCLSQVNVPWKDFKRADVEGAGVGSRDSRVCDTSRGSREIWSGFVYPKLVFLQDLGRISQIRFHSFHHLSSKKKRVCEIQLEV